MRLSEKHGVNPSMELCFFCGKEKGIMLLGKLPGDKEAPRSAVFNQEPCDECADYMKQGIILIETKDEDPEYRLGGFSVVTEAGITRLIDDEELLKKVLRMRCCFIGTTAYQAIIGGYWKEEK